MSIPSHNSEKNFHEIYSALSTPGHRLMWNENAKKFQDITKESYTENIEKLGWTTDFSVVKDKVQQFMNSGEFKNLVKQGKIKSRDLFLLSSQLKTRADSFNERLGFWGRIFSFKGKKQAKVLGNIQNTISNKAQEILFKPTPLESNVPSRIPEGNFKEIFKALSTLDHKLLWNKETKKFLDIPAEHSSPFESVGWSADLTTVAIGVREYLNSEEFNTFVREEKIKYADLLLLVQNDFSTQLKEIISGKATEIMLRRNK